MAGSKNSTIKDGRIIPWKRTAAQKSYFFLNGNLYKTITSYKATDLLYATNFTTGKMEHFVLSEVKKKMKPAYGSAEVAHMLNRSRSTVKEYVWRNGAIEYPVAIYPNGMNRQGKPFTTLKWSEEAILSLHDFLLTLGGGRPRKDGIIGPAPHLPSRAELLAALHQQPMFYMQTSDGEFVPVWQAYNEV